MLKNEPPLTLPTRLAVIAMACLMASCATVDSEAQKVARLRANSEYVEAVGAAKALVERDPTEARFRLELSKSHEALASAALEQARAHVRKGEFERARQVLASLSAVQPFNVRAAQAQQALAVAARQAKEADAVRALIKEGQLEAAAQKAALALRDDPSNEALLSLKSGLERQQRLREQASASVEANATNVTLDFKDASLRAVLDALSRSTGLNYVLDKDLKSDIKLSMRMQDVNASQALNVLLGANGLAKKQLDPSTVVIYANTADKQRDYQEQVVRQFHLANVEAKTAGAYLKAMLKLKEPFVDDRANSLTIRESPENVALAEQLLTLIDAKEPEVTMELEVLEVSSSKLTELGIRAPDTFVLTPAAPTGGFNLGNIGSISRDSIGVGLGSLTLNLKRELGDFRTLANPRVRSKSKEKATVMIGDKIPVVTATTSSTGFVSESVNYLDVGLKVNVEPTVFPNDDVSVKVSLEVSTLGSSIRTASGGLAYQIGTRSATTALRLKDGETQLLAGLISKDERNGSARIPGLGDVPVLGRLFSSERTSANQTELVLAVTPRIVRNVDKLQAHEAEVWIGTEANPRLTPYGGLSIRPGKRADQGRSRPRGGTAASDSAMMQSPGADRTSAQFPSGAEGPQTQGQAADESPKQDVQLSWDAVEHEVAKGKTVEVTLNVDSSQVPLYGLPLELQWDVSALELVGASDTQWLRTGGAQTVFGFEQGAAGAAIGSLQKQIAPVTGRGAFMKLKFRALKEGAHEVSVSSFTALSTIGRATTVAPPPTLKFKVSP